ncbi:MAG: ATP-binding protein [Candidatus Jettenia caeni]|nr:MAG: ATP-binding protein [Candidatus Jettenia caeni]
MFVKAQKSLSKARICIAGPAGSGKTYSALLIASGLSNKPVLGSKRGIAMIDTEHGSGALYSDILDYDILELHPPFEPKKYIEGIKEAENAGYDIIIIDSLSHAWAGEGGLLDMKEKVVQSGKGNDWTAWRHVTPHHNKLVEAILQSQCHVIATARSKMKYAPEEEDGKIKRIRKIGLDPVLREGMEYEFTIVLDMSSEHVASSTKDRTSLFDGQFFKPDKETGQKILAWLNHTSTHKPVLNNNEAHISGKSEIPVQNKLVFDSSQETRAQGSEEKKTSRKKKSPENNSNFLKTIEEIKEFIDPETFDSICHPYEPIKDLFDRERQIELYKKLKEAATLQPTLS